MLELGFGSRSAGRTIRVSDSVRETALSTAAQHLPHSLSHKLPVPRPRFKRHQNGGGGGIRRRVGVAGRLGRGASGGGGIVPAGGRPHASCCLFRRGCDRRRDTVGDPDPDGGSCTLGDPDGVSCTLGDPDGGSCTLGDPDGVGGGRCAGFTCGGFKCGGVGCGIGVGGRCGIGIGGGCGGAWCG